MVSNPNPSPNPFLACFAQPTRFDQFMHQALYAPAWGYYARGHSIFGAEGDFITAPQLSPLFGQTLAQATASLLPHCQGRVVEFGAGLGHLAAAYIAAAGQDLHEYCILEVSAGLQAQQAQHLQQSLTPSQYAKVRWLNTLPQPVCALVLANEVLDAQPVRRFQWHGEGKVLESFIHTNNGELQEVWQPADAPLNAAVQALHQAHGPWPLGYTTEWHEQTTAWVRTITEHLQGVVLVLDYGHSAAQYYQPSRSQGTLRAMRQHIAHNNLLADVGEQDLTAHVNFSAVYTALCQAGGDLQGYTTQSAFLLGHGILDLAAQHPLWLDPVRGGPMRQAVHTLISEASMGQVFKVMCWSKALALDGDDCFQPFLQHDDSGLL